MLYGGSYVKLYDCCTTMRRPHISNADLEQYCMGRVHGVGLQALEAHLIGCAACSKRAKKQGAYLRAMRGAIKMLLDSPEECDIPTPR